MQKRRVIIIISLILFLCALITCCSIALISESLSQDLTSGVTQNVLDKGDPTQTVAVIKIEGVITQQPVVDLFGNEFEDMKTTIIRQIDQAEKDENVNAILLEVNSPGGEAYASREIYNRLMKFKESGKKLVVLMKDQAASGGYYVSLPADSIVASASTTTGSIGVIVSGIDLSGLYEKVGIKEFQVANSNGNMKVLKGLEDPNSEGYKVLQSVLDDVYDEFVTAVAKNRGLTIQETETIADGRIYSGRQAQELNLVDKLGELEVAKETVKEITKLENPNFVLYEAQTDSFSIYSLSLTRLLFPEMALIGSKTSGISIDYTMPL